jgi:cell division protease FtsH
VQSTRLSIRKRGESLGHHQAIEKQERFSSFRSEDVSKLVWTLGAMAAERVFYGENSRGVGGDVASATLLAATMVGAWAMGPERIDLSGRGRFASEAEEEEARKRVMERFERIGYQIMHRSGGGMMDDNPFGATLSDGRKRPLVAQLIGQAFLVAYQTVVQNREGTDYVANRLIAAGELYGEEVTDLLDEARLRKPEIDVLDDAQWPTI